MIKKLFLFIMLIFILFFFFISVKDIDNYKNDFSKNYYINNTYEEVGAKNFVTGIYLDYRLFDSVFEASILLITITGIIFMSKKDEEMY